MGSQHSISINMSLRGSMDVYDISHHHNTPYHSICV